MIDLTKKEALQVLLRLPEHSFKAVIKLINPKLNDNDLRPMFPEGWNKDECWMNGTYNYDAFRKHQLIIDEQLKNR